VSDSSIPPDDESGETSLFLGDVTYQPEPMFEADFSAPPETNGSDTELVTDLPTEGITDTTEPESLDLGDVKIGDGECHVCGAPTFRPPGLTPSGRKKRAPRYCDLHDPKRKVSKERSFTGGVDGAAQLQRIQEELADDLRLLGVMAGPLLPVTGVFVFENADPFTIALLKLCKNNQRALRVLHRAASVAPIYEVAKDCAGVFYAAQVDMKKLDPHNTVSQRLGVERAYNTVYPEDTTNVTTNGATGPPRYAATS
jgi:hypothetical protein